MSNRHRYLMPLYRSWHDYNESLVERGRVLMDISFLRSSNKEIRKMNEQTKMFHNNISNALAKAAKTKEK
jgi:hypothetical protein